MRVLMLDLDTLRPDHLGCYGYHRQTSPNIDRIAAEGVRFEKYYVTDAPCLPARAALVSGMFGIHNGAVNHGGLHADMRLEGASRSFRTEFAMNCLWRVFRKAGMHTCTISPFAERHTSLWFLAGFNEIHNHIGKGGNEEAQEVTPIVMKWLEDNAEKDDWFLHVNFWDPHTPYRAPEEFGNPFKDDPIPEWITEEIHAQHLQLAGPHTARDNCMYHGNPQPEFPRQINDVSNMEELKNCFDGYDCGIRFMDEHIGKILSFLEEKGILEDTAIIVTSDHGENFGELGIYSEHGTADNITCRIPMIIKWPGMQKGHVDKGFHYQIDLAPTLSEILNTPKWDKWDGESFADTLKNGSDTGRDEVILNQCAHVCQRSVRWDKWLYMRTYHDGFHPHFEDEMLFDVENDPHETTNLVKDYPEVVNEGAKRLLSWHDNMMKTMPFGYKDDPMQTILSEGGPFHANVNFINTEKYKERLKATDRGHLIEEIKKRHPKF